MWTRAGLWFISGVGFLVLALLVVMAAGHDPDPIVNSWWFNPTLAVLDTLAIICLFVSVWKDEQ